LAMTASKTSKVSELEKVACPKCGASLKFRRSSKPHIDECGFQSYSFKCRTCGSLLVGIVDPADDTLLFDDVRRFYGFTSHYK
jgi:DNA-directed RNA polymerase subunit RPC12/RpoP